MAKKRSSKKQASRKSTTKANKRSATKRAKPGAGFGASTDSDYERDEFGIETTGNSIATFGDTTPASASASLSTLKAKAGVKNVCRSADFSASNFSFEAARGADAVVFDELGIAVIIGEPDRRRALRALATAGVRECGMIVEPETINYSLDGGFDRGSVDPADETDAEVDFPIAATVGADYLLGYTAGVNQLAAAISAGGSSTAQIGVLGGFDDSADLTWGLQATRVLLSPATGRGIRVAVLDTGMDLRHPDFAERKIESNSFVPGEGVQDRHGHGTHCIGTACGPKQAGVGPRYGIAYEAEIFAGKVLNNAGNGSDGSILAGINWALQNGCPVISMSLGRPVRPGELPMHAYEEAGRRAIERGSLILAAAGNGSSRPSRINPVNSPANASMIASVAAIDERLRVARFSDAGINPRGGEVNFAGPGLNVRSSWPMPIRYKTMSGTSMATPHLAGIAALIAQEDEAFRGLALYNEVWRRARSLPKPRRDVGNGLGEAV